MDTMTDTCSYLVPRRRRIARRRAVAHLLVGAAVLAAAVLLTAAATPAGAAPGPPRPVPCPVPTAEPDRYRDGAAPYRCRSAVVDPLGTVVILREGRPDAAGSAFGWAHALVDRGVEARTVERVVSSALPVRIEQERQRYTAEFRAEGDEAVTVRVEIDRGPSNQAPDTRPFGVLTASCVRPGGPERGERCPAWVTAVP